MSAVIGKYVRTFAEATHALPQGMHMNADYPFKLPRIVGRDASAITIAEGGKMETLTVKRGRDGDYCWLEQSSSFERWMGHKPTKFRLMPFKATEQP